MYIIVSDVDSGHASGIASDILTYCPNAIIETRIESFSVTAAYVLTASIVDGIARATTGLSDSRITEIKQLWDIGVWVVHALGSNSNVYDSDPTYLGEGIVTRSPGTSYGPGIEFTVASASNQSQSTGYMAGMFGQIRHQNSWSIEITRQSLREKSDNWSTGWNSNTGFGNADFLQAVSGSNTYLLNTITSISSSNQGNYTYLFDYTNISSSYNQELVILSVSGNISSSLDSGTIIYESTNTGSSFLYENSTFTGSLFFGVYSSGSNPSVSRLENYSLYSMSFSYAQSAGAQFIGSGFANFYKGENYTPGTKTYIS